MKKLILLTFLFLFSIRLCIAQSPVEHYFDIAGKELSNYHCTKQEAKQYGHSNRIVHPKAYKLLMRPIFSNVIVGNNDLVQNTSAASFVQDKDKGTLNINYGYMNKKHIVNIGAFAKSKDGVFGIYTNKSWNSEIGMQGGYTWAFSSGFYKPSDCSGIKAKRELYMSKKLTSYKHVYDRNTKEQLEVRKSTLEHLLDIHNYTTYTSYDQRTHSLNYDSCLIELKKVDSLISEYDKINQSYDKIKELVEQDLVRFDTSSVTFEHYSLHWINTNIAISNNSLQLTKDSLPSALKSSFTPKNLLNINVSILNYNYMRAGGKITFFAKIAPIDFSLTNVLNHPVYKETPVVRYDSVSGDFLLYDQDRGSVFAYDSIRANLFLYQPNIYAAAFFLSGQNIGLDARASFNQPLNQPFKATANEYKSTFTVAMGPIFRLKNKSDNSKGTVGVEVGIFDAFYKSHVWKEHFGARLKIGVPFNVFEKK